MNKVILVGRLTRDPEIRYTSGENQRAVARYTLAVERRRRKGEDQTADFISCVVFDRGAEFAEKYLFQGTKIVVSGRLQTGSYTNRDGRKVYTTDVVIDEQEFAESKNVSDNGSSGNERTSDGKSSRKNAPEQDRGFMNVPDGMDDIPFD